MFIEIQLGTNKQGYIAGAGNGVVTINDKPARRDVFLLDIYTLKVVYATQSLENGYYLFYGLDANKRYLEIARDYERHYEPVTYDYVKPEADLTVQEQRELWQSWQ